MCKSNAGEVRAEAVGHLSMTAGSYRPQVQHNCRLIAAAPLPGECHTVAPPRRLPTPALPTPPQLPHHWEGAQVGQQSAHQVAGLHLRRGQAPQQARNLCRGGKERVGVGGRRVR